MPCEKICLAAHPEQRGSTSTLAEVSYADGRSGSVRTIRHFVLVRVAIRSHSFTPLCEAGRLCLKVLDKGDARGDCNLKSALPQDLAIRESDR